MSTKPKYNRWPLALILIWLVGVFLRCYRQSDLLGFYYDQGRDAQISQDILTGKNFPAIGPTTGIDGLYLGPLWYYLITPGYFFANGNPAIASCFVAILESLTIPLLFFLLKRDFGRMPATIASFLWAISPQVIHYSRWFSNPTPLPLVVSLILYLLIEILRYQKKHLWPLIFFLLGISLQLEAASAFFFFPIIILIAILNFSIIKKTPVKYWILGIVCFVILLIPQIAFDFKNNHIISQRLVGFLTGSVNSHTGSTWGLPDRASIGNRLMFYFHTLFEILDIDWSWTSFFFLVVMTIGVIIGVTRFRRHLLFQILLIWLFLPLILLMFFKGNYNTLYAYYLVGFFPAFICLFSLSLAFMPSKLKYLLVLASLALFLYSNMRQLYNYLSAGVDGPQHITLGNQIQAVEYLCQQSTTPYNLNIYVPPVIPYSYNYLIDWYHRQDRCQLPQDNRQSNQLVLYEVDNQTPPRFQQWYRDLSSSTIVNQQKFGGISVEQRLFHVAK